ncbi:MAG: hypothetical protein ACK4ND_10545 [Cytophagaceae bacterium]
MKHFVLLALFVTGITFFAQAQMSSRLNDSTAYQIGSRPTKGTKALTFGVDFGNEWVNPLNLFTRGDLLTGRYFLTDNLAIRSGFRIARDSRMTAGDIDTLITGGSLLANHLQRSTSRYIFVPGIERHFAYSNIFDVYAGGDIYMGLGRDFERQDYDYAGGFYNRSRRSTPVRTVGFGGVVGVNFFILDLPLSIGFEYGWTALWNFGGRTRVTEEIRDALGTRVQEYYQQERDAFENPDSNSYSTLSRRFSSIDTNNNIRILLNLYFR